MTTVKFHLLAILFGALVAGGQPYLGVNPINRIDVNGDGAVDFVHGFSQEQGGTDPERWSVGFGISPYSTGRFLRYSDKRAEFNSGELISSDASIFSTVISIRGQPLSIYYDFGLTGYESAFFGFWTNWVTPDVIYADKASLFLGTRVVEEDGPHFGWVHLIRPDTNPRTPFLIDSFATHPIPGQAIRAGDAADLPVPLVGVAGSSLSLKWDPRWGPLGVEYTTNLSKGSWKRMEGTFVGGAALDLEGEGLYFRLLSP